MLRQGVEQPLHLRDQLIAKLNPDPFGLLLELVELDVEVLLGDVPTLDVFARSLERVRDPLHPVVGLLSVRPGSGQRGRQTFLTTRQQTKRSKIRLGLRTTGLLNDVLEAFGLGSPSRTNCCTNAACGPGRAFRSLPVFGEGDRPVDVGLGDLLRRRRQGSQFDACVFRGQAGTG
jgi:hypothetical protein